MSTDSMIRSSALRETHGVPEMPREAFMSVAKAFKVVLAADGELHPKELAAYRDTCRTYGATDDVLRELDAFDPTDVSVEQAFGGMQLSQVPVRGLLYDVIKAAQADGDYASAERGAVETAARVLGVGSDVLAQITALVDEENALRDRRHQLLATPTFAS
jgi:tellurite resistance protein